MVHKTYELLVATQSKPFAWGPLAIALYINNSEAYKSHPITISPRRVDLLQEIAAGAIVQLVSKAHNPPHSPEQHVVESSLTTFTGISIVCQELAKEFPETKLWGDHLEGYDVYIAMSKLLSSTRQEFMEGLTVINQAMKYSAHPVDSSFSLADLELWGAIKGNPQILFEVTSGRLPEIERWFKTFMELQPITTKITEYVKEITAVHSL
jgi:glutathione S-transferase